MKDKIRDHRSNPCLWIETRTFDDNIERIGVFAWAVYTVLVRHAGNGSQKCSPSQERIGLLLNCSRNTVAKAIRTLAENNMIAVEQKEKDGELGRYYHEYTLLALSPAKKAGFHGSRREQSKPKKSDRSSGERSRNEQELCPGFGVVVGFDVDVDSNAVGKETEPDCSNQVHLNSSNNETESVVVVPSAAPKLSTSAKSKPERAPRSSRRILAREQFNAVLEFLDQGFADIERDDNTKATYGRIRSLSACIRKKPTWDNRVWRGWKPIPEPERADIICDCLVRAHAAIHAAGDAKALSATEWVVAEARLFAAATTVAISKYAGTRQLQKLQEGAAA